MTSTEIKDTLRDCYREVARLTTEIIAQKRRLHHRHTLYHAQGIPTSRLKLEMMRDRLRELTAERSAVQRGIDAIEAGFGQRKWGTTRTCSWQTCNSSASATGARSSSPRLANSRNTL